MADEQKIEQIDPEIVAIGLVHNALRALDSESQTRVLEYVRIKLGLQPQAATIPASAVGASEVVFAGRAEANEQPSVADTESVESVEEDEDGISPIAKKWMRRSGFDVDGLSHLFSIGGDEIELVAKGVPGKNKKEKMHSVILLKGIAAYLSGGVARVSHQQVKETSVHYDAFDSANFAAHLKDFAGEVSGDKKGGYSLTARGMTAATELVRSMIKSVAAVKP